MTFYSDNCCQMFAVLCTVFLASIGMVRAGTEEPVHNEVPKNKVLISKEMLKSCPWLSQFKWPGADQIRDSKVSAVKKSCVELSARERLQKIMQSERIPNDIVARFVPLKGYLNGADALLTRYGYHKDCIYLFITSAHVRMIVWRTRDANRDTRDEKIAFVQDVVKDYFNKAPKLLPTFDNPVEKRGGLQGGNLSGGSTSADVGGYWYKTFEWWTNGTLVYFNICTNPGTSAGCVDQKEWFALRLSLEQGLRGPMEELTENMIKDVLELEPSSKSRSSRPKLSEDDEAEILSGRKSETRDKTQKVREENSSKSKRVVPDSEPTGGDGKRWIIILTICVSCAVVLVLLIIFIISKK